MISGNGSAVMTRPGLVSASALGGLALAASLGAVAVARRDRPLHAYGSSWRGTLTVTSAAPELGVPLVATAGGWPVVARVSRAMSLTQRGPDIPGLALRVPGAGEGGGDGDLLFAGTGTGVVSRHLLALRTSTAGGPLTTLLPARSAVGLVLLALRPETRAEVGAPGGARDVERVPQPWRLAWSRVGSPDWHELGELVLEEPTTDPGHFDPTGRPLVGLEPPPWVLALRDPAYRTARRLVGPVGAAAGQSRTMRAGHSR